MEEEEIILRTYFDECRLEDEELKKQQSGKSSGGDTHDAFDYGGEAESVRVTSKISG